MAVPHPQSPTQIALVVVGVLVGLVVVLPLVPTVLDIVFGTFRGVFDVIVPGGRTT